MDLAGIRTTLLNTIKTVEGLNVDNLRDNPIVPCAIVVPETPFDLRLTFDGNAEPQFVVLLLVPYNDTGAAQDQLDGYLSTGTGVTSSVVDAIEASSAGFVVEELKSYGVMQLHDGGTRYLSAELLVRCWV